MAIYTKSGDKGETSLIGGKRVPKDSPRIIASGVIDELNSFLGLLRIYNYDPNIDELFVRIQNELFTLGADLACPPEKPGNPRVTVDMVKFFEQNIDEMEAKLPKLQNFILPGGTPLSCYLHLARNVCRRAERKLVALARQEKINDQIIPYINRLSDLLFTLARFEMFQKNKKETIWKGQQK